jgi:hypothetical protein
MSIGQMIYFFGPNDTNSTPIFLIHAIPLGHTTIIVRASLERSQAFVQSL